MSITYDISQISKPRTAVAVVQRAKQYLDHMKGAGKPVAQVAIKREDYDQIFRAVNAARAKDPNLAPITSLRIGDVAVKRGGL
jgi:hypothetical protein